MEDHALKDSRILIVEDQEADIRFLGVKPPEGSSPEANQLLHRAWGNPDRVEHQENAECPDKGRWPASQN